MSKKVVFFRGLFQFAVFILFIILILIFFLYVPKVGDYITGYQSRCNPAFGPCGQQGGGDSGDMSSGAPGNGVIEGSEECDDDDLNLGDGCGENGQVEEGWTCSGEPSVCTEIPPPEPESPSESSEPIINLPQNRFNPNYQLVGSSGGGGSAYASCAPVSCEEITLCVGNIIGSVFSPSNLYSGTQQVSCVCADGSSQAFTVDCYSWPRRNLQFSPSSGSSQNPPNFFIEGFTGGFTGLLSTERRIIISDKDTGDYVASVTKRGDLLDIEFFQLKDLKSLNNVPEYCYNSKQDSQEEGIDCGGSCKSCRDILFSPKRVYNYNIWWAIFLILIAVYLLVSKNKN